MKKNILIIGACGQIGSELTEKLRTEYDPNRVIAADIRSSNESVVDSGPFELLDATDYEAVQDLCLNYDIEDVYLMAAMLSATGEKFPMKAWHLNMQSLLNVLSLGRDKKIKKIFWPSSIAVFGPDSPKQNTPQNCYTNPNTVYGISKLSGEQWCAYYHQKFNVDVRSIRYPGLISWKTAPGGGTTDYAVEIYHEALQHDKYTCFLNESTRLPMMYMDDAIRATTDLMNAPAENISVRTSYNLSGTDFTPQEQAESIRKHLPKFKIDYAPDYRQAIADSWPESIDDSVAKNDWNWQPKFDLEKITEIMLKNLS
ncbi:MAG: NAD-dependent epimerase/dehydratase family protein [Flavobacteriaceae bacterium]|nr:NAD-dependent epimerase/dehydratase family protein [Flavobacteriaceae bacterium]